MGFIADEPLGDLLDDEGLDSAGQSLRKQQRKAQAIDRDLPEGVGIDLASGPDMGADALYDFQRRTIDRLRRHPMNRPVQDPDPRFMSDQELQPAYHKARTRGDHKLAEKIYEEGRRRGFP